MTRTNLLSVSLITLIAFPQFVLAVDNIEQQLSKADDLLNNKKAKASATLLRSILRSAPNNAQAHMQLGAALATLADNDDYEQAIAEEKLALKFDPKSFGARKILGHIYANQHKTQEAIALMKEACEIKPSSFAAQRDLATAYVSADNLDEAVACLKKAIELKPELSDLHIKLALILSKKKDYPAAIAEATKAVQLSEKKAETHLTLANIKLDSGDYAGSIEHYKTAIEKNGFDSLGCLNPVTMASALSGLGWAIANDEKQKNLEQGILNQRKAIKAYPPFLNAYIRLAELQAKQGKKKEAEASFQSIFKLTKGDPKVGKPYANFLESLGRKDEANAILNKIQEKPKDQSKTANPG